MIQACSYLENLDRFLKLSRVIVWIIWIVMKILFVDGSVQDLYINF